MASTPIDGKPCQATQRLSQATLLAYLPEGSKIQEMFLGMSLDEWEVISFNSRTREVCVELLNDSKNVLLSFIIPAIVFNRS